MPGMNMNPKQMKQMQRQMKKMGMDMKDLPGALEVIIRFEDKEITITEPEVNLMSAMGTDTYQIVGNAIETPIERELIIPDEDIELVSNQANVSKEQAEQALKDSNGDLAEAILSLNG